mmetsp:Transcript_88569/g.236728  ORF Transcript_88569/g.236728 Transcript_88569/m.236728 type:complete len:207 (+) Transcript_88569:881-1501(+)
MVPIGRSGVTNSQAGRCRRGSAFSTHKSSPIGSSNSSIRSTLRRRGRGWMGSMICRLSPASGSPALRSCSWGPKISSPLPTLGICAEPTEGGHWTEGIWADGTCADCSPDARREFSSDTIASSRSPILICMRGSLPCESGWDGASRVSIARSKSYSPPTHQCRSKSESLTVSMCSSLPLGSGSCREPRTRNDCNAVWQSRDNLSAW